MFANQIRDRRRQKDMSATELAFRSGVSARMLYAYERGETEVPLTVARAIAGVLDATVDEVFPEAEAVASP